MYFIKSQKIISKHARKKKIKIFTFKLYQLTNGQKLKGSMHLWSNIRMVTCKLALIECFTSSF